MRRLRQRGSLLIAAVVIVVLVALLAVTAGFLFVSDTGSSSVHARSEQALFVANGGIEAATFASVTPVLANRVTCTGIGAGLSNQTVGTGQFTVPNGTRTYVSPPTTLSVLLSAAATVIPVAATASYAVPGRILIDRETIDVMGTSASAAVCGTAPCFTGARRGRDGTSALAHAAGRPIGQFQCNVQSTGGIPNLINPTAKRILLQGTQLQEAWAVGAQGANLSGFRPWFVRFQELLPWVNWTFPVASQINAQLNSISMMSYVDGWAVGNASGNALFLHWDGSAWARNSTFGATTPAAQNLNGVYCIDNDNCYAVGVGTGGSAQINYWNGTNWNGTPVAANMTTATPTLNQVYCNSTTDCWAVGNALTTGNPAGNRYELVMRGTGGPPVTWARQAADPTISNTANLAAVRCVNASNCWAVGQSGNAVIYYWNGATWVSQTITAPPALLLNSVFCNSTSDCWAVGNADANEFILRCSANCNAAPTWTRLAANAAIPNVNLNEVRCVDSNDCWIVGDADAVPSEVILHWDGSSWTRVGPVAGVDNRNLLSISVIGAQAPGAVLQESFP